MINNPDCGIGSVENILSWIERPYFSNYALVYRSRSLQGPHRVDYLNPRAIVYGTDQGFNLPNLIMAFNGSSAQPGFNSLEMMELNVNAPSIEGLFNFFEVEFPGSGSPGPIRVSAFNPPKCIRCHGSPAKPVFDSYPFWPGVFGSMRFPTPHVINLESTHYSNFISRAARHSRYQFLTPYKQESSCVGSDCSFLS